MDATSCKRHACAKKFNILLTCASRTSLSPLRAPCQHGARQRGVRANVGARGATVAIGGNTPAHRAVVGHAPGELEEGAMPHGRARFACKK